MFGRINLVDTSSFNGSFLILLILLVFAQVCNASLSLYNITNELIRTYSTVDFMWVNTFSSKQVNGTITIASFSDAKQCTLNPVPINTVILLVPFNEGLNYGCSYYSDIIESNIWLQKRSQTIVDNATVASKLPSTTPDSSTSEYHSMVTHTTTGFPTDTPTSTMTRNSGTITMINTSSETSRPDHWDWNLKLKQRDMNHINPRDTTNNSSPGIEVLIFTSMNGGYPGINEKYVGSLQTLSKTAPALTLIRITDMSNVYDFLNQTSYAVVTRDSGPWIDLLNSKEFLIWTIIVGILYVCIIIIALGLIVWGIYKNKYTLDNPKPWLLAGIILCATLFPFIFTYDPWGIRYHRMSDIVYQSIVALGYFFMCINYTIFLFPWIKATRNLADDLDYRVILIRRISRIFFIVIILNGLIKIISFLVYVLANVFATSTLGKVFIIAYVVLEMIFILLTICGYAIFGRIIILARKNDLVPIVDPTTPRNNGQARRVRTNKEILEAGILTILLILSFLFITGHTLVAVFLNATISNFWIVRITDDLSFVIGCTVLLIALHSDSISKYSHMTYVSSPEDTGTENSRDTSRSSSNGGGTSTRNRKRTTIEILFGRKSFVGL